MLHVKTVIQLNLETGVCRYLKYSLKGWKCSKIIEIYFRIELKLPTKKNGRKDFTITSCNLVLQHHFFFRLSRCWMQKRNTLSFWMLAIWYTHPWRQMQARLLLFERQVGIWRSLRAEMLLYVTEFLGQNAIFRKLFRLWMLALLEQKDRNWDSFHNNFLATLGHRFNH